MATSFSWTKSSEDDDDDSSPAPSIPPSSLFLSFMSFLSFFSSFFFASSFFPASFAPASTLARMELSSPWCSLTHPSSHALSSLRSFSSFRLCFSSTNPNASSSLPLASSLLASTSSTFFRLSSAFWMTSSPALGSVTEVSSPAGGGWPSSGFGLGSGALFFSEGLGLGFGAGGGSEMTPPPAGGAFANCLVFSAMVWFIFSSSSAPTPVRSASLSATVALVSAPLNCF